MTAGTVHVRARWLDGRIETLNPMEPGVESQEIKGLGQDLRWYSFRHSGEIDAEGFLIFVQGPDAVAEPPTPASEVLDLSAQCFQCGKHLEIRCKATNGFGTMKFYSVQCPYCFKISEMPLPDDIVEILKAEAV